MRTFGTFNDAVVGAKPLFGQEPLDTGRWQGISVTEKPEMQMHEVLYYGFQVILPGEDLDWYREDIKPNLPWADDHFAERVCGAPINPGVEWANWGNSDSARTFIDHTGQFNHNYMERYWPKYAGAAQRGTKDKADFMRALEELPDFNQHVGIRHEYGDLAGVVRHLAGHPLTRQAYLPVWFPEDTGDEHEDRKPCTIGYHFQMRHGKLNVFYHIRSCDFTRHFRDDIYLTVRLQLWVLEECRKLNPEVWNQVNPGRFIMFIDNLHMFRNDYLAMVHNNE